MLSKRVFCLFVFGKDKLEVLDFCQPCAYGKCKRVKFTRSVHVTKEIMDYVHVDLWGPSRFASHGGGRYFLSIIDDFSRKQWVHILKTKNKAFNRFK